MKKYLYRLLKKRVVRVQGLRKDDYLYAPQVWLFGWQSLGWGGQDAYFLSAGDALRHLTKIMHPEFEVVWKGRLM